MPSPQLLLNGRAPISSYGAGAFQFAGRTYQGGLLILADGIYAWECGGDFFRDSAFFQFLDEKKEVAGDFFLLGTGARTVFPPDFFKSAIEERGLSLDMMDTGAACRTYNILLAESRLFAAGLLPI